VASFTLLPLYLQKRASGTHWIRVWVGPRAVLDAVVKYFVSETIKLISFQLGFYTEGCRRDFILVDILQVKTLILSNTKTNLINLFLERNWRFR
jgi:hypothetical protein